MAVLEEGRRNHLALSPLRDIVVTRRIAARVGAAASAAAALHPLGLCPASRINARPQQGGRSSRQPACGRCRYSTWAFSSASLLPHPVFHVRQRLEVRSGEHKGLCARQVPVTHCLVKRSHAVLEEEATRAEVAHQDPQSGDGRSRSRLLQKQRWLLRNIHRIERGRIQAAQKLYSSHSFALPHRTLFREFTHAPPFRSTLRMDGWPS